MNGQRIKIDVKQRLSEKVSLIFEYSKTLFIDSLVSYFHRKNTMKVKIINLPNGYKRIIYGKYFEQFDLDYKQDLDVLKKDIEFALSVIEYNRSIFKKFSSLFKNKNIFVYQGGHHLDIIDRDKGSLEWLTIEDHWTKDVDDITGSWKMENLEISRQTQYAMQLLKIGKTDIEKEIRKIKQRF